MFEIQVKHGQFALSNGFANISKYSEFCHEREVLFNPLNYFKIKEIKICTFLLKDEN